ncbi:MAG TPA: GTPase Era [bacterium]|nr:GTPase Era [bacterium]
MSKTKCGFVAIVGRPNVGKSTLLNRLVGEKLAGVSPKPQTTRGVIRGILTRPEGQIIYLDTPGHHDPHDSLGRWMIKEIEKSVETVDLLYFMVLPREVHRLDKRLFDQIKSAGLSAFLLVNQIDRYPKPEILPVLTHYHGAYPFKELIPISAKEGDQVDLLVQKTLEHLPEGAFLYDPEQISDQEEKLFVSEMIREKIFHLTEEEIPYATSVSIESFKEREDGLVSIQATIVVERDSQKAIVIGKRGQKLKEIGMAARVEIEHFLGKKVFLELWLKTYPHWKKDDAALRRLGYK